MTICWFDSVARQRGTILGLVLPQRISRLPLLRVSRKGAKINRYSRLIEFQLSGVVSVTSKISIATKSHFFCNEFLAETHLPFLSVAALRPCFFASCLKLYRDRDEFWQKILEALYLQMDMFF